MANTIIKPEDFINYSADVILASCSDPRKRLIFVIDAIQGSNGQIDLITNYHVKNKFDQVVHSGSHLKPTIKEYNKL
jgi:hypothetical protein